MIYWTPHCTLSRHVSLWEPTSSSVLSLPSKKAFCYWRSRTKLLSLSFCECFQGKGSGTIFILVGLDDTIHSLEHCVPLHVPLQTPQALVSRFVHHGSVTISYINSSTTYKTALYLGETEAWIAPSYFGRSSSFPSDTSPWHWLSASSCHVGRNVQCLTASVLYVTVNKPCSQSHVRLGTASYMFQEIITFFVPVPWDLNRSLKQLEAVLQDQLMHSPFLSGKEEINPDGWTWCCLVILLFLGMFISTMWTFMRLSPTLHQS